MDITYYVYLSKNYKTHDDPIMRDGECVSLVNSGMVLLAKTEDKAEAEEIANREKKRSYGDVWVFTGEEREINWSKHKVVSIDDYFAQKNNESRGV